MELPTTTQGVLQVSVASSQPSLTMMSPMGSNFDVALIFFIVLSSLGMIGNALVCFVMLRHRKVFHSTTNKLIIHQSLIDFIGSTIFLTRRFALVTPPVPNNFVVRLYCRMWWSEWVQYSMFVTSTYNLVAISTERYMATCHPVKHRNMFSSFRMKLLMLVPWIAGWVPAAHAVFISYYDSEAHDCGISWPSLEMQAIGGVLIFLQEMIIPITIMVFTYSRIIWSLHQRSRVREGENNSAAREMFSKANRNVTITLVVVAAFFAICWLPADVYYLLYNLNLHPNFIASQVYEVTSVIVVMNLCINPFIYAFAYERFRKQLKQMFCGHRSFAHRIRESRSAGTSMVRTVARDRSTIKCTENTVITTSQAGCSSQGKVIG